ncbi:MAG: hypothetical protein ACFE0I_17100 [Elainellaceae cyanobacterium]
MKDFKVCFSKWLLVFVLSAVLIFIMFSMDTKTVHAKAIQATEQIDIDFSYGLEDWSGGFADYPAGNKDFYELGWGWLPIGEPLSGHGFYVTGDNRSDDLFMFIKGQVSDLKPETDYLLNFEVTFATNTPQGCVGIGGAPGEAVFVKAGATKFEPKAISEDGIFNMNIDKGNQSQGGSDAQVIGNVANLNTDCNNSNYEFKVLRNDSGPFAVRTDSGGRLWIIVGTDSGFEGRTTMYYEHISITIMES